MKISDRCFFSTSCSYQLEYAHTAMWWTWFYIFRTAQITLFDGFFCLSNFCPWRITPCCYWKQAVNNILESSMKSTNNICLEISFLAYNKRQNNNTTIHLTSAHQNRQINSNEPTLLTRHATAKITKTNCNHATILSLNRHYLIIKR